MLGERVVQIDTVGPDIDKLEEHIGSDLARGDEQDGVKQQRGDKDHKYADSLLRHLHPQVDITAADGKKPLKIGGLQRLDHQGDTEAAQIRHARAATSPSGSA